MSGSLGPIGGVDASIPLQAGKIMQSQPNPLASVGDFARTLGAINSTKLQQQALTSGAASVAQHLQQVGSNAMAPFLAIDNPTMKNLTDAAGYAEGIAGGTTQHILQIAGNNPFPVDTPQWGAWMKRSIAALAQIDPTAAVAQAAGTSSEQQAGGTLFSGVKAPATAGGGFTPTTATNVSMTPGDAGQQYTWHDKTGAIHEGTKAQYNEALGNGQVNSPAVVSPVARPTSGASAAPGSPSFGNPGGRYQPTSTQPGNPALHNPAASPAPPQAAVEYLRKNPALAKDFDTKYGLGAAKRILGQ